jgi:hypothetical protein
MRVVVSEQGRDTRAAGALLNSISNLRETYRGVLRFHPRRHHRRPRPELFNLLDTCETAPAAICGAQAAINAESSWKPIKRTDVEKLTYRYTTEENGLLLRRYWTNVCQNCAIKNNGSSNRRARR